MEYISVALRKVFIDVKVGQSTALIHLAAIGHVGVVIVFLLTVFLLAIFSRGFCQSCWLCVDNGLILVCGHSDDGSGMVWTDMV